MCPHVHVCVNHLPTYIHTFSPLPSPPQGAVACGLLQSVLLFLPALLPVLRQQLTAAVPDRGGGGPHCTRHSELETVDFTLSVLICIHPSAVHVCSHSGIMHVYVTSELILRIHNFLRAFDEGLSGRTYG